MCVVSVSVVHFGSVAIKAVGSFFVAVLFGEKKQGSTQYTLCSWETGKCTSLSCWLVPVS